MHNTSEAMWPVSCTYLHELHGLGPSRNDLVGRKLRRLSTIIGRIKDSAINQGSVIMTLAHGSRSRVKGTRTRLENLVLQTRGQGNDAGLLGIFLEKGNPLFVGSLGQEEQISHQEG